MTKGVEFATLCFDRRRAGVFPELAEDFTRTSWLLPAIGASIAVWLCAIALIARSAKFLRKWLWVVSTFITFSIDWELRDGADIRLWIPLGALYVIWFWRCGAAPTAAQVERRPVKIAR